MPVGTEPSSTMGASLSDCRVIDALGSIVSQPQWDCPLSTEVATDIATEVTTEDATGVDLSDFSQSQSTEVNISLPQSTGEMVQMKGHPKLSQPNMQVPHCTGAKVGMVNDGGSSFCPMQATCPTESPTGQHSSGHAMFGDNNLDDFEKLCQSFHMRTVSNYNVGQITNAQCSETTATADIGKNFAGRAERSERAGGAEGQSKNLHLFTVLLLAMILWPK